MTDFDDRLGAALDADDEAFLKRLDDRRGLFAQMGDTMTGPLGGWARLVFVITGVLVLPLFFAIYQAVTVTDLRQTVLWCAATVALLLMQGMSKQWLFDRINLLAVLRELKRIELRIARIEDANLQR